MWVMGPGRIIFFYGMASDGCAVLVVLWNDGIQSCLPLILVFFLKFLKVCRMFNVQITKQLYFHFLVDKLDLGIC